jgi:hypothetical protein
MVMYSYFEIYDPPKVVRKGKRRRVGEYDPNASKADKRYTDNYGL